MNCPDIKQRPLHRVEVCVLDVATGIIRAASRIVSAIDGSVAQDSFFQPPRGFYKFILSVWNAIREIKSVSYCKPKSYSMVAGVVSEVLNEHAVFGPEQLISIKLVANPKISFLKISLLGFLRNDISEKKTRESVSICDDERPIRTAEV